MASQDTVDLGFLGRQQEMLLREVGVLRQEVRQVGHRQVQILQGLNQLQDELRTKPSEITLNASIAALEQSLDNALRGVVLELQAMLDDRFPRDR